MQMAIRRSAERGQADHGWLRSQHTFSFAGYRDPRFMGFGHLRVINQDVVEAGRGFGTHPHRNMEILSYVVRGGLEHKDTIGTGSVIRPGEVQLMSAGSGIAHSEFNASKDDEVEFLQIWVLPAKAGGPPTYQQHDYGLDDGVVLVASPEGRDGSLKVGQDVDIWRVRLPSDGTAEQLIARSKAWVQVVRGPLEVNGALLMPGDGLAVESADLLTLRAPEGAEALVFDLL